MATVLCVNYEWNLGFDVLRKLADAGYRVLTAASGQEALRQLAARPIDALVVNERLPDISLREVLAFFKHHEPDLPVVMVSNVMPAPQKPEEVDSVIGRHHAAELLVPTLEALLPVTAAAASVGDDQPRAA